jgi:hypothetical protein
VRVLLVTVSVAVLLLTAAPRAEQLGGKPASLSTAYKTEYAWAIGESVEDIAEMAAAIRGTRPTLTVPPDIKPWTVEQLVPLAAEALGPSPANASANPLLAEQYAVLADLTAASVVRASTAVDAALRQNLRSARAHESTALVLAAFGLREAAGYLNDLSDVRWVLNRMTSHLAVAAALRAPDGVPGIDGQFARVAFLALSNRTASGLKALDQIDDRPADPRHMAWKRALRLRLTDDWRITPVPAKALRIEKLEYFRARRKVLNSVRAGEELSQMAEPVAIDFARIVQAFRHGVEDGTDIVEPSLGGELLELSEVYRLVERRDLEPTLPDAIVNARPGRLMSGGRPRVIPWGAWAQFFQRHAGLYVGQIDDHYRRALGLPQSADQLKPRLDALLGHLTLFPLASSKRTKGRGTEADLTHIRRAIELSVRAPELVSYGTWAFLEMGARYEVVQSGMPERLKWFAPPSADVPYEAGARIRDFAGHVTTAQLHALVTEATSDVTLAARSLMPRPESQKLVADVRAWFMVRGEYDLYAVDQAERWSRTLEEQLAWRRRACALAMPRCSSLAAFLAWSGDEAGAVREYERVFRDPGMDLVAFSNSSAWLVSYYERNGQLDRAYDLAQRSAAVGSARGLDTLARLYERRNRLDEALEVFERIAKRYQRASDALAGFLYRQAVVAKRAAYLDRWRTVERLLFPSGLQPMPPAMPDQPARGVFIYDDSSMSRRVRLQIGDIIVGVDGWRVENKEQYDAVMEFTEPDALHKITAWRGVLLTVELPQANGMELQSYPLRGWIQ